MERGDIAERFNVARRAGMQRTKALQSAGMPILVHGPMFAAGPPEMSNPLVRQLLTAKKELLVPDGNTRPVTLQSRAAVYTKNSKDLSALLVQPTRNEGLIFLGRYADTAAGLIFIPSEAVNLSPKLDTDFTYARNVAMVVKVYSSTRSTSNSLLQGTMDAVSLFDYRDLTSSSRAAIMKAAPGDNSYVVGIPASMGVCLTTGPEGIPDEFNQPESITGRDDRGNDLKYDFFSYRTDGRPKVKWGSGTATIASLSVEEGSLVPNLINAPVRVQGILTADAQFVIGVYITCKSAAKGRVDDDGEYIEFKVYDYYPSVSEKLYPGTGGPFFGVQFSQEYSAESIAASAIKDNVVIGLPFIITKIQCVIGQIGKVGAESGTVHWAVGSLIVPGYFGSINGPTSVVLLNGFDNECESSCGQSIEIQASQLVEATPSGALNQYIDPSSSLQRFSDSSMLSLAMVAFNTGADGLRRAWVGTAYSDYVSGITENRKQVGTVVSTLQAAGPLGDLGRQLGNLVSGIPIIGGLAKGALGGIGDMIDNTLFSAGMPVAGRTGFAAGPEEDAPPGPATVESTSAATQTGDEAGQSLTTATADEAEATMHKLISLETPGISAFTDQTYSRGPMAKYQYAMKQLQKSRITATLVEWGTTPEEVAETLTDTYHKCAQLIDQESVPDALALKVKGGLAKTILETVRCCKGLPPIHSSPEAIGILSEPVLTRRLRTGLCAGTTFTPNGVATVGFGTTLVTPQNQVPAADVMSLHANNFMGALQSTLSGRSTYPEGDWGRYAYFPVMEKVGDEIVGSVETVIISNRPVMDRNSQGENVLAVYRAARFTISENERQTSYTLKLENSFLPADTSNPTPDEHACLSNICNACFFTGVPENSYVACPAFDKVVGPSLGLAVAAASLGLNTDAVYTGGLAPQQYPGPMLVTEVGYLPAKISAAGAVNKMLICPNQADANNVLLSDTLNQGLFASMSDIISGHAQKSVSAIIVNNLTEAMLASASLRFARKGEKAPVDEAAVLEQQNLAKEMLELGNAFKAGDPALESRTWQVMVGNQSFDIPLFNMDWWKQYAAYFGPGPRQIRVTPATIRSHMEHGSYKKLLGLASQVQARHVAATKASRSQSGGGGALSRVGQEVRMRRSGILQPTKQNPSKRPRQTGTSDADWSWGGTVSSPQAIRPAPGKRARTTESISEEEETPDFVMDDYGL